jgi:PPOX class probable F420-dependent enzyme
MRVVASGLHAPIVPSGPGLYTPTVTSLADVEQILSAERYLGEICTIRRDGSVQASVVNVGVMDHPGSGAPVAAFVARGDAVKLAHLRRDHRVTVVARSGWQWAAVEGTAELVGPDDPNDAVPSAGVPELLRAVFRSAGGTHDDWDTYDRTMADERRVAVLVTPTRIYSNG